MVITTLPPAGMNLPVQQLARFQACFFLCSRGFQHRQPFIIKRNARRQNQPVIGKFITIFDLNLLFIRVYYRDGILYPANRWLCCQLVDGSNH